MPTPSEISLVTERRRGAMAMLGFARRLDPTRRETEDWMKELREGES